MPEFVSNYLTEGRVVIGWLVLFALLIIVRIGELQAAGKRYIAAMWVIILIILVLSIFKDAPVLWGMEW